MGVPMSRPLIVRLKLSDPLIPPYDRRAMMNPVMVIAPSTESAFFPGIEEMNLLDPVHNRTDDNRKPTWIPMHLAHRGICRSPRM